MATVRRRPAACNKAGVEHLIILELSNHHCHHYFHNFHNDVSIMLKIISIKNDYQVKEAVILGHDGNVWAASQDFSVNTKDSSHHHQQHCHQYHQHYQHQDHSHFYHHHHHQVTPEELKKIVDDYNSVDTLAQSGVTVAGTR